MDRPELQQFARQLAAWTELVIDNGRTPFRKVTLYTPLQTEQGLLAPPLVFWINRQSMMAGGLLMLPGKDLAAELERGRCCAEALALRHFVTWEADRIRIWQLEGNQVQEYRVFSIGVTNHPDSFRLLLNELLEALKLLTVIGLVPPTELSVYYLLNLFLATLELSFPSILDRCRSQRALEPDDAGDDTEFQAREINRLTLLQLLTLLWEEQLPSAILPEKLGRAIELSLPKLSLHLQQALTHIGPAGPNDLPHESAVCFHHLLLRLRQLNWQQPRERALAGIRLLIDTWYPSHEESRLLSPVVFYPSGPVLADSVGTVLSDSATLMAAQALLEELLQQTCRQQYYGTLFQFGASPLPSGKIAARLLSKRRPTRDERHHFSALLRTSWPNRRFRITGDKPFWLWETLHLLGLCAPHQELQLVLPQEALQLPITEPFWPLLQENYRISELHRLPARQALLKLSRDEGTEQSINIVADDRIQRISASSELAPLRAQLLLALTLPAVLFALIDKDFIWPTAEFAERFPIKGLEYYAQSGLGRLSWQLLAETAWPESTDQLLESLIEYCWPVPETRFLLELEQRLTASPSPPEPARIDRCLAELWGCPELSDLNLDFLPTLTKVPGTGVGIDKDLYKEILAQISSEGVPSFPEQYLYFLDNPATRHYHLAPPLRIHSEFLGQFELLDANGKTIQVYGEELARALQLCGELDRRDVDLPADREQLELILDYYRQDLRNLRTQLKRLCHSRLANQSAARKMANKIWRELQLPAEKWIAD